jgi:hypothetical protein
MVGIARANRGRFRKYLTVNLWSGHPRSATGDCGKSKTKKGADSLNAKANTKTMTMRKRIGSTVYVTNVYLKNGAGETIDEIILRLIKNDLHLSARPVMMELPQTGRLSERGSA